MRTSFQHCDADFLPTLMRLVCAYISTRTLPRDPDAACRGLHAMCHVPHVMCHVLHAMFRMPCAVPHAVCCSACRVLFCVPCAACHAVRISSRTPPRDPGVHSWVCFFHVASCDRVFSTPFAWSRRARLHLFTPDPCPCSRPTRLLCALSAACASAAAVVTTNALLADVEEQELAGRPRLPAALRTGQLLRRISKVWLR